MNGPKPIPPGWSGGRFWLVAALLLAGQAGWVLLLGERPRPPHHAVAPRVVLRLLDTPLDDEQLTKHFFASDPTVFPSFSPHGFADQVWPKDEPIVQPGPPPAFLAFTANWSGAILKTPALESRQTPSELAGPLELPPAIATDFPASEASRPESFLRIAGALAGRRPRPPAALPAWTNSFLLSNSMVQFGVNRSGQVISAVLLDGSGLKEADDWAVAAVNVLRFEPVAGGAPEFAWDTAGFYWKTIEPPQNKGP